MEICRKESVSALAEHVPMEVLTCVHMYVCYTRQEAIETERVAGAQNRQKLCQSEFSKK